MKAKVRIIEEKVSDIQVLRITSSAWPGGGRKRVAVSLTKLELSFLKTARRLGKVCPADAHSNFEIRASQIITVWPACNGNRIHWCIFKLNFLIQGLK